MEAFESFVAVALESDGFVVSSGVKFSVVRQTRRADREEYQEHGYEVDLIAARADKLVLATVKSFLGSRGVAADQVLGHHSRPALNKRYALLNDVELRTEVIHSAAERYGYYVRDCELRFYVGRFAGDKSRRHEMEIRDWARTQRAGSTAIQVIGLDEVVDKVLAVANSNQYRDNPALVAVKVLREAGMLRDQPDLTARKRIRRPRRTQS